MQRIVMLGCGTGVGKTHVGAALLKSLKRAGVQCIGLKPIETGLPPLSTTPSEGSDAATLSAASSLSTTQPHPLYAFEPPISPHLAARLAQREISIERIADWLTVVERDVTLHDSSHSASWVLIESAGGVFSPVAPGCVNFDLARALEPATWILVAPDALGVLHDVTSTLEAMRARGRSPDYLVLSAAREPDASMGTNADELRSLGIANPVAVLARGDDRGIDALTNLLLANST